MSSRAIAALLDRIEAESVELHSIMVVRRGHVVAEGWWAPDSPERPHLLYSLTKSFTSIAVGLVIEDGLLSLDDLVVANFVSGPGSSTLPMVIFSKIKLGVSPDVNALASVIIGIVALGVVIATILQLRRPKTARV